MTNPMALGYTDESTGADGISEDDWWEILSRDDVDVARSDPAVDPNGYRSVMATRFGAVGFQGERLYDRSAAQALQRNARVTAGTETDLVGQLGSDALDHAWEYRSAGATYGTLNTRTLQPHVNLARATAEYATRYAQVEVQAGGGSSTSRGATARTPRPRAGSPPSRRWSCPRAPSRRSPRA